MKFSQLVSLDILICLILKIFPTRYLRCSKHVPVRVLKKLIKMKFDVKRKWEVRVKVFNWFRIRMTFR